MLTIHSSLLAVQIRANLIAEHERDKVHRRLGNRECFFQSDSEVNSEEYTKVKSETVISAPARYSQASVKVKCYMLVDTGSAFQAAAWERESHGEMENFAFRLANSFHPFIYYTNNLFTVR